MNAQRRCGEAEPEPMPRGQLPKIIRQRTVLVFGQSQVGKSHLLNLLVRRPDMFREGALIESCTTQPQSETFVQMDAEQNIEYHITVVDTPGMFDSRAEQDNRTMLTNLVNFVKYSLNDVHRIFYVFKVGAVSQQEIKCLQLLRQLLSEEACGSGICSLVITYCDGYSHQRREDVKAALARTQMQPLLTLFHKPPRAEPEIIAADFSPTSTTVEADRGLIMQSILEASQPVHKSQVLRIFVALQELQDRQRYRTAFLQGVPADLRSFCPTQ